MSGPRSYEPRELQEFLRLLDREVPGAMTITVIGGAAIGLLYDTRHATADIDLTPIGLKGFWEAVARTQRIYPVPLQTVAFFVAPYDYEERRVRLPLEGLERLTVLVPEEHDLAIMKAGRAEAHDLAAVADVHAKRPLDLETLIHRYYDARTQVTGSPEDFALNFLALVERLYGTPAAERVSARLRKERPPPPGDV
jgi:hypothetical protein